MDSDDRQSLVKLRAGDEKLELKRALPAGEAEFCATGFLRASN
jgi:hypothetical protein